MEELFAGSKRAVPQFRRVAAPVENSRRRTVDEKTEDRQSPSTSRRRNPFPPADKEWRTVFVGNLPLTVSTKEVKKLFSTCGPVESVRFRSAVVAPGKLPVGVARRLRRQLCGTSVNCYVVFRSEEGATRSLQLNGSGCVEYGSPALPSTDHFLFPQIWVGGI